MAAEKCELEFTADAIDEIARTAWMANDRMENIGARRLHTVMSTLVEDMLFDLPDGDPADDHRSTPRRCGSGWPAWCRTTTCGSTSSSERRAGPGLRSSSPPLALSSSVPAPPSL